MVTVLLAELRTGARRALATGLAVCISVAFLAAVLAATASTRQFVVSSAAGQAEHADVVVAPPDGASDPAASLDAAAVSALRSAPGVAASSVLRTVYLQVRWPNATVFGPVTSLPQDASFGWFDVVGGRMPRAAGEVLVDEATARSARVAPGSTIGLVAAGSEAGPGQAGGSGQASGAGQAGGSGRATAERAVVVGVVRGRGPQATADRLVLAADADVARWQARAGDSAPPHPDAVLLRADAGVSPDALLAVAAKAAPRASAVPARTWMAARAADRTHGVDLLGRLVVAFTAVALLVAAIVVANTFTILLAQRTERLALLRCLGARRGQLRRSVLLEAAVLGLVASSAGVLLGLGAVVAGAAVLSRTVAAAAGAQAVLPGSAWLLPLGVGILLTVVAGFLPVLRATRVTPLAALRPVPVGTARRAGRVRSVLGALLLLGGAVLVAAATMLAGGTRTQIAVLVGIAGGTACVLAVVALGPVLVPRLIRGLGAPVRRLGPVGDLAVGNTLRSPRRSAATAVSLFVGVGLITVLSVGAATTRASLDAELDRQTPVDLVVPLPGMPASQAGAAATALARLPGTQAAAALRRAEVVIAAAGRAPAGPATASGQATTSVLGGPAPAVRAVLRGGPLPAAGTIVVPASFAGDAGLTPGGPWTLRSLRGTVTVRPVISAGIDSAVIAVADLDRLGAPAATDTVWLRAADRGDPRGYLDAVRQVLADAGHDDVAVSGPLLARADLHRLLDVLLAVTTALLAVAVLVSLVGVGSTLSLAVLERGRECALQRALGMTQRQLRRMLAVEAALLAGAGVVLGLVLGVLLGWAGSVTLLNGAADVGAPQVPVGRLAVVAAVAVGAALVASVLPGRRAARVSPTVGLAAE